MSASCMYHPENVLKQRDAPFLHHFFFPADWTAGMLASTHAAILVRQKTEWDIKSLDLWLGRLPKGLGCLFLDFPYFRETKASLLLSSSILGSMLLIAKAISNCLATCFYVTFTHMSSVYPSELDGIE